MITYEEITQQRSPTVTYTPAPKQNIQPVEQAEPTFLYVIFLLLLIILVLGVPMWVINSLFPKKILKVINIFKKTILKIKKFAASKRNRGIFIISFLLTCFSYFVTSPLFIGAGGYGGFYSARHGFPWGFTSARLKVFDLFYFILDLVFWFIVVKLILLGISLIKDSKS